LPWWLKEAIARLEAEGHLALARAEAALRSGPPG